MVGSDGRPVINATAVIGAIREQLKIETQYRAMFGVDLATRPGPLFDEDALLRLAEIRVAQRQLAAQVAAATLPALPPARATMTPAGGARRPRRRGAASPDPGAEPSRRGTRCDDDVIEARSWTTDPGNQSQWSQPGGRGETGKNLALREKYGHGRQRATARPDRAGAVPLGPSRDDQRLLIITFVGGLASIVTGACVIARRSRWSGL